MSYVFVEDDRIHLIHSEVLCMIVNYIVVLILYRIGIAANHSSLFWQKVHLFRIMIIRTHLIRSIC